MVKYIIFVTSMVFMNTLFVYKKMNEVNKRINMEEERLKNYIEFEFNKLRHQQTGTLFHTNQEIRKLIKSMINHKEIKGRIGCFKEFDKLICQQKEFEYPGIPILYTEDILNVGEVVKVEERYLEITGIAFLGNEENQYTFDYIA